jgi:hypothetical protein
MATKRRNRQSNAELFRIAILESAREAAKLVTDASAIQIKSIAEAAGQARTVVTAQASEAAHVLNVRNADGGSDHDVLTRLDVKVDGLKVDIRTLTDGTATRLAALEKDKLDVKESYPILYQKGVETLFDDHEDRMREVEIKINKVMAWGAAAVLLINVVGFIVSRLYK